MSRTNRIKNAQVAYPWTYYYWKQWYPEKSEKWCMAMLHRDGNDWCMTTPSSWIHDTSTIKERQQTRNLLQQVYKLIDYEDSPEFPLDKKPYEYYW